MKSIDQFLRDVIQDRAMPVMQVREAAYAAGYSPNDVNRAKKRVGIRIMKGHGVEHAPWYWYIGPRATKDQRRMVEDASGIPWITGKEWWNQPSRRQRMLDLLYPPA